MNSTQRVVLVDDNADCNFIMREFIRMVDDAIEVKDFTSASDALDHLRSTAIFPDIIYVDINMPVTDGFALIEQLQQSMAEQLSRTRIYMLSSSIRTDDRDRALAMPLVSGFISKGEIESHLKTSLAPSGWEDTRI